MHLIRRHVELVLAAVLDVQIVTVYAAHIERHDAEVLADTVVDMHDVVAWLDVAEMGDLLPIRRLGRKTALHVRRLGRKTALHASEDILFREHDEMVLRELEACEQPADLHAHEPLVKLGPRLDHR